MEKPTKFDDKVNSIMRQISACFDRPNDEIRYRITIVFFKGKKVHCTFDGFCGYIDTEKIKSIREKCELKFYVFQQQSLF